MGVLLRVGRGTRLTLPGAETPPEAAPGDLIYVGSRLATAGLPFTFAYHPDQSIYTFTPIHGRAPGYNVDQPNAAFEVRFGRQPEALRGKIELARALPAPLFLPESETIPRSGVSTADVDRQLSSIDAALRLTSPPEVAALLRFSRAALLERASRLDGATAEYKRLATTWSAASWITKKKLPSLAHEIDIERAKRQLAGNQPRTYAVLVGISRYQLQIVPAAEYADRDVTLLQQHLRSPRGGAVDAGNIILLTNERAKRAAIRRAIGQVLETTAGPRDTVYVYLSGQGWIDQNAGSPEGYLMTYDSNPEEKEASSYSLRELSELIRRNLPRVRRVFVIADLCRADEHQSIPNTVHRLLRDRLEGTGGEAEIILASGSATKPIQTSRSDRNLQYGLFGYHLVTGLQGAADANRDRAVTADELIRYLVDRVGGATDRKQVPEAFGSVAGGYSMSDLSAPGMQIGEARRPKGIEIAFAGPMWPRLAFQTVQQRQSVPDRLDPAAEAEDLGQQVILRYLKGEEAPQVQNDFDLGAKHFREAQRSDTALSLEARAAFCEGRSLTFAGDTPRARQLLEEAVRLEPDAAYAYNGLGIAHLRQAAYRDAAWAFRDAIARAPHWIYPRHNLALTYSEAGAYSAAEREYRQAIRLAPEYFSPHYSLGALLHKLNRLREAEREYRTAISLRPDRPEAYVGLGAVLATQPKARRSGEAEKQYRTALRLDPRQSSAKHNLALLYARDDPGKAIELWVENLREHPDFTPSRMSLAEAYRERKDFAAAVTQYEDILKRAPNYIAARMALHESKGDELYTRDRQAATREYDTAAKLASSDQDRKRLQKKLRQK